MPYDVKQAAVQAVIEAWKNLCDIGELAMENPLPHLKLEKALNDLVIAWEEKE